MATGLLGSRKWMLYTSDIAEEGNTGIYAVLIDESNGEACGFQDYNTASNTTATLPRGFRMRYANCKHPTESSIKRRFWIGSPTKYASLANGSDQITTVDPNGNGTATINWIVSSVRGEKSGRLPFTEDTELNDGDST